MNPPIDVDLLVAQLLQVLGEPSQEQGDRLDNILSNLEVVFRGTREDRLKEWFLHHDFLQHLVPNITDELSAQEAKKLCQSAGIDLGSGHRPRKTQELVHLWLRHHRLPPLECANPLHSLERLLEDMRSDSIVKKQKPEDLDGLCLKARKLLERFSKELLTYTWALLTQRCRQAVDLLHKHCQKHHDWYGGRIQTDPCQELVGSFPKCDLTLWPLCRLLDKLHDIVEKVREAKELLAQYVSHDWHFTKEEVLVLETAGKQLNPELHDHPGDPLSSEKLSQLLSQVAALVKEWKVRGLLARICQFHEIRVNAWGNFLRGYDLSNWDGQTFLLSNPGVIQLYFRSPPAVDLGRPVYVYLANNPLPVKFVIESRPSELQAPL